jgi:hypothetical protein
MQITDSGVELARLYTGDDGESHLEMVTYAMKPAPNGLVSGPIPVTGMTLRIWDSGPPVRASHNSTRRQLIVHLAGGVRVEASDGASAELGVGSVLLSENIAPGKGHESHQVSMPRLHLILPFADGSLDATLDVVSIEQIEPEADSS